jgi:hypothetical protein
VEEVAAFDCLGVDIFVEFQVEAFDCLGIDIFFEIHVAVLLSLVVQWFVV